MRRHSVYVAPRARQTVAALWHQCVILNACESARGIWAGLAPTLVRADIPAVVAMQWPIEDRAAITFAKSFYRTLAAGRAIDECVSEGRVAIDTASPHSIMWAAPVLFIRSLDGQLWAPQSPRRQSEAETTPRRAVDGVRDTDAAAVRPRPLSRGAAAAG